MKVPCFQNKIWYINAFRGLCELIYTSELCQMLRIFTRYLQAVIVRPLSTVSALVRFAKEPQMFAIEFSDGCPIHVSICYVTVVVIYYVG